MAKLVCCQTELTLTNMKSYKINGARPGKRGKGRPRMCYIGQIIKDVGEKKY